MFSSLLFYLHCCSPPTAASTAKPVAVAASHTRGPTLASPAPLPAAMPSSCSSPAHAGVAGVAGVAAQASPGSSLLVPPLSGACLAFAGWRGAGTAVAICRQLPLFLPAATGLFNLPDAVRNYAVNTVSWVDGVISPDLCHRQISCCPRWVHHSPIPQAASEQEVLDILCSSHQIQLHLVVEVRLPPVGHVARVVAAAGRDVSRHRADDDHVEVLGCLPYGLA